MNDDNELSEIRESLLAEGADLAGVRLDRPAAAIMARGRSLRLRRRLLRGASGVTAAGAAMALVLTLPLSGTGLRQVHVNEADWSVNTGQNGTVIVALRRVSDPLRLQAVLARAGVPATVHLGESCLAPGSGQPATRIVTPRYAPLPVHRSEGVAWRDVFSVRPALMPAHTKLVIGTSPYPKARSRPSFSPVIWTLIPAGARLTCTKYPLGTPPWRGPGMCAPGLSASPAPSPYSSPSPGGYSSPPPSPSSSPSASPYSSPSPGPSTSAPASPYSSPSPGPRPVCRPFPHMTRTRSPRA